MIYLFNKKSRLLQKSFQVVSCLNISLRLDPYQSSLICISLYVNLGEDATATKSKGVSSGALAVKPHTVWIQLNPINFINLKSNNDLKGWHVDIAIYSFIITICTFFKLLKQNDMKRIYMSNDVIIIGCNKMIDDEDDSGAEASIDRRY